MKKIWILFTLLIVLNTVNIVASNGEEVDWNAEGATSDENFAKNFENDPVGGFKADEQKAWQAIEANPDLMKDPKVLDAAFKKNKKTAANMINKKSSLIDPKSNDYSEEAAKRFDQEVKINPGDTDEQKREKMHLLNDNPAAKKEWFAQRGITDEGAEVESYDGTTVKTKGAEGTIFNINDHPGARVLSSGKLILSNEAEIASGTVTKAKDGSINVQGGHTDLSNSKDINIHVTKGVVQKGDKTYSSSEDKPVDFSIKDKISTITGEKVVETDRSTGKTTATFTGTVITYPDAHKTLIKGTSFVAYKNGKKSKNYEVSKDTEYYPETEEAPVVPSTPAGATYVPTLRAKVWKEATTGKVYFNDEGGTGTYTVNDQGQIVATYISGTRKGESGTMGSRLAGKIVEAGYTNFGGDVGSVGVDSLGARVWRDSSGKVHFRDEGGTGTYTVDDDEGQIAATYESGDRVGDTGTIESWQVDRVRSAGYTNFGGDVGSVEVGSLGARVWRDSSDKVYFSDEGGKGTYSVDDDEGQIAATYISGNRKGETDTIESWQVDRVRSAGYTNFGGDVGSVGVDSLGARVWRDSSGEVYFSDEGGTGTYTVNDQGQIAATYISGTREGESGIMERHLAGKIIEAGYTDFKSDVKSGCDGTVSCIQENKERVIVVAKEENVINIDKQDDSIKKLFVNEIEPKEYDVPTIPSDATTVSSLGAKVWKDSSGKVYFSDEVGTGTYTVDDQGQVAATYISGTREGESATIGSRQVGEIVEAGYTGFSDDVKVAPELVETKVNFNDQGNVILTFTKDPVTVQGDITDLTTNIETIEIGVSQEIADASVIISGTRTGENQARITLRDDTYADVEKRADGNWHIVGGGHDGEQVSDDIAKIIEATPTDGAGFSVEEPITAPPKETFKQEHLTSGVSIQSIGEDIEPVGAYFETIAKVAETSIPTAPSDATTVSSLGAKVWKDSSGKVHFSNEEGTGTYSVDDQGQIVATYISGTRKDESAVMTWQTDRIVDAGYSDFESDVKSSVQS